MSDEPMPAWARAMEEQLLRQIRETGASLEGEVAGLAAGCFIKALS
jgi:hypothetical protein